jgi:hypothetical protein
LRTIYLHVGPPKTGTSALQHLLREYKGPELIYPPVGLWRDGSHHNLVLNFYADYRRPEVQRGDTGAWLAEIGELARTRAGSLVISSEGLFGRDVRGFADALLEVAGGEAAGWRARVVVVCREHFERTASLYNQAVKDPVIMERRSPDEYLAASAQSMRYMPALDRIGRAGLPLDVLNYHPRVEFVPRFLRHVGIADPGLLGAPQRNVSLSRKALVATLAANRVARTRDDRERMSEALRSLRKMYAPTPAIFGRHAMLALKPVMTADRQALASRFGVELPQAEPTTARPLVISSQELAEIRSAAVGLGSLGEELVDSAREWCTDC